jgi:hypothetical protein
MKCRSKNSDASCVMRDAYCTIRHTAYAIRNTKEKAFSLVEAVTALIILALVSSSVLVVINRCMVSTADSALRMQAFEVARDNMETILSKDSVEEMVEYGSSDKYPAIQWQTAVETFYEPVTERMWVKAVCSAEYADTAGDMQTIELTHWLTALTKEQLLEIIAEKQRLAEKFIETAEEAAAYAGVDVATIQQWVENGMPKTEDGSYDENWLDLYANTNGEPTAEEIEEVAKEIADSEEAAKETGDLEGAEDKQDKPDKPEGKRRICGYTIEELRQMDLDRAWEILSNCDEFIEAGGKL